MTQPKNPDTIIVKNKYYPKGLTERNIWNYYQSVKSPFLNSTKNRDLSALIMTDINKPIIRRRNLGGTTIRLTPQNYDKVITGRTIGFYSAMTSTESIGIIDIDIHPNDGFNWAKKATVDVFDYVMDKMPLVRKASIVFTGKTSFYIICDFQRKMKIDSIKFMLIKFLQGSEIAKKYTIDFKRQPGISNIDLNLNKIRGNFITLHSLSIIGLKCMEVEYNQLKNFDPRQAIIK